MTAGPTRASRLAQVTALLHACADASSVIEVLCRSCVDAGARWASARLIGEWGDADVEKSRSAASGERTDDGAHEIALIARDMVLAYLLVPDAADRVLMEHLAERATGVLSQLRFESRPESTRDPRRQFAESGVAVTRRANEVFGATAMLHVVSEDDGWLMPIAAREIEGEGRLPEEPISRRDPIYGAVLRSGRARQLGGLGAPDSRIDGGVDHTLTQDGRFVVLIVPLLGQDRVIGTLTLTRRRPFSPTELALSPGFAGEAASILQHARIEGRRPARAREWVAGRDQRDRLGALQFFTTALVDAVTSSEVANTLVDDSTLPLEISGAAVALREGDDVVVVAIRGAIDLQVDQRLDVGRPHPLVRAVTTGLAQFHEGEDVSARAPLLAEAGISAVAAVPLRIGARVLGSFLVAFGDRARVDEEDRRFLRTLARQAAHALDRSRLYDAEQRAHERLARLADATALLASTTEWPATVENVMRILVPDVAEACVLESVSGSPIAARGGPLGDQRVRAIPLDVRGRQIAVLRVRIACATREREGQLLLDELARRIALALDAAQREHELREAVRVRDEFLSIAGHELKTPLTTLRLYFWSARKLGDKSPVTGELAEKQLERFERLVNQLLDVHRLSEGQLTLKREDVDLAALTHEIVDTLVRVDESTPVVIQAEQPVVGHWDPLRLGQIVTNLVANAVKYGCGNRVDVVVENDGDTARLRVRDRGIGIDAADRSRIFERFERAVSSREFGGLGLGLWITREIVRAHGGSIDVAAGEGRGTEFVVELPRTAP